MTIYGKCGNVRIQAKIKGLYEINENKVWRNLWQSEIIYGRE
jgi:ribosomal protein S12 methylthiotransferase accessory factor YcaO